MNNSHQQSLNIPWKWFNMVFCLGVAGWLGASSIAHAAIKPTSQNSNTLKIAQLQSGQVYYQRGRRLYKQGNYRQAIEVLTHAINSNLNYADAYVRRGMAYYQLGQYQEAISDYNQAIEIDPNSVAAYYNRGLIFEDYGDINTAISNFEKAAKLDQQQGNAKHYHQTMEILEELK